MRENPVKKKLQAGGSVTGTMVSGLKPTGMVAQMAAAAGFDFAMITMEHSIYSIQDVHDFAMMARALGVVPLVRVPDLTYQWVAQVLDVGVLGVMAPRIQGHKQVEELVSYVRFPPAGIRGWGGGARLEYGLADRPPAEAMAWLNADTIVIAQIEQKSAIEDIDAIASVDGVDVCLIGPYDLSISLGTPGDLKSAVVHDAIAAVVEACQRHGKVSAAHLTSVDDLAYWAKKGMRWLMCNSDQGMLSGGWRSLSQQLRKIGG